MADTQSSLPSCIRIESLHLGSWVFKSLGFDKFIGLAPVSLLPLGQGQGQSFYEIIDGILKFVPSPSIIEACSQQNGVEHARNQGSHCGSTHVDGIQ